MQALDAEGMRKKLLDAPYHLSRKIDGEFSVLVFDGKEAFLLNPGGTVRAGLALLTEAATALKRAGFNSITVFIADEAAGGATVYLARKSP